jgi:hypothetical protein
MIRGNHGLLGFGGHTAVVEDHVDAYLVPPGVGAHSVALEGCHREVHSCPCGGALLSLLTCGGVNLDNLVTHHFGAGLLCGSGGGLALFALCHSGGLVLVNLVVDCAVVICIVVVGCITVVVRVVILVCN